MLENLLLGVAYWLVRQGEGWQGGFAVAPLPSILNVFSGERRRRKREEGDGGEALRAQEAGLIPISWRGANVHAIYCMTASHISINPRHKAGNRKGGAEGAEGECWCVERKKEEWENKKLGERCNREKRSEILLKLHMQKPEMDARTTEPVQII